MPSDYKDDPKYFAQTADSANGDPGLGDPKDRPSTNANTVAESTNWKSGTGPVDDATDEKNGADVDDQHPPSRSADPGQSSDGGFKNEGPSDQGK